MSERLRYVCPLEELAPGTMRRFDFDDVPLVVCRSERSGEVFALDARCPHQGALLCFGRLTGIKPTAGQKDDRFYLRGEIIECPLHLWEFDVRTGYSLHLWPRYRTPTYPVSIEDGNIFVGPTEGTPKNNVGTIGLNRG